MPEVWRPVPACRWFGIPAKTVEVSADGSQVRTVERTLTDGRRAGGTVLAATPDRDGYPRVTVGRRKVGVHVLACLAFHGPPEVRHLNDQPGDNTPGNLAWGSRRENERDKKKTVRLEETSETRPSEVRNRSRTGA